MLKALTSWRRRKALSEGFPQSVGDVAAGLNGRAPSEFIWRGPESRLLVSLHRQRVISIVAAVLAAVGVLAWWALFTLDGVHPSLLVLAALIVLELAAVPWLVRGGQRNDIGGALVMASVLGCLALTAYLAGGVNQPLMGLAAAVPVLATVLLSPRAGLVVTLLLCGMVAWFLTLELRGYAPSLISVGEDEQTLIRGIVILLGTVLAAVCIWTYESYNRKVIEGYRLQSQRDVVSGLPNRWQFEAGMRKQLMSGRERSGYACMLLVDLDGFREFNDKYGRSAADELLHQVGRAVRASLIGPDNLIARFDGDCYAVFAWCASRNTVRALYDRIQLFVAGVEHPEVQAGKGRIVTVSIGVGLINGRSELNSEEGGGPADLLYARAAAALRNAQQSGRNKVKFHLAAA